MSKKIFRSKIQLNREDRLVVGPEGKVCLTDDRSKPENAIFGPKTIIYGDGKVRLTNMFPTWDGYIIDVFFANAWQSVSSNIEKVIFNNRTTIVLWKDKTKTKATCLPEDTFNKEVGVMICTLKKLIGNRGFRDLISLAETGTEQTPLR